MRALIASLSAALLVATSACSSDPKDTQPYGVQSAAVGQSLAVLGWNMSLSNLRFDGDYVLFDVDAWAANAGAPQANPEDIRFGLYGVLAHPLEANAIGGCRGVTSLAVVDGFRADGGQLDPTALGDPNAFNGKGYMLLGLEITGVAARYREESVKRGGPLMVLVAPTLPAPGLSQGDMNAALLYASSLVGTHAGLWTTDE